MKSFKFHFFILDNHNHPLILKEYFDFVPFFYSNFKHWEF